MTNAVAIREISQQEQDKLSAIAEYVLASARKYGASDAEVGTSIDDGLSVTVRLGDVETLEYNRDKGVGVTVYFGQTKGSASTSDTSESSIDAAVKAACDIAKFTAEDDCAGLADKNLLAKDIPDLDLYHPWDVSTDDVIEIAKKCEKQAMAYDKRINNSEGATIGTYQAYSLYANSNGFMGSVKTTRHSLSCIVVASQNDEMQRDYEYTMARDAADLESAAWVAEGAAKNTLDRLAARRVKTDKVPVIFRADIASGLISRFIAAVSGGNLYRKSSFLLDQLGQQVFPEWMHIYEQPFILKALGSAAFDAEGVATKQKDFVKDGILQSYCLGSYSARKLGMQSTANAGGVHNLTVDSGDKNLEQLLKSMQRGLLVTEVMGQGVNIVTGDYSRGAAGFWVENGEVQFPVSEITIAGNLKDMFKNIIEVGNDVDIRGNIRVGSILLENMTVAGQ